MVFCNVLKNILKYHQDISHNPYFNRWFSAISFSYTSNKHLFKSHNPYFNRWFSAIYTSKKYQYNEVPVTILILIDGFLQYELISGKIVLDKVTILILIDGFLQYEK